MMTSGPGTSRITFLYIGFKFLFYIYEFIESFSPILFYVTFIWEKEAMSKNTISNFCNTISIWCLNHDEPLPMSVISNTELIKTPFYACEKYIPDGSGEKPCSNRLNLDDYLGIVEKFVDIVVEEGELVTDFTNFEFTYRGTRQKIFVRCIKYTNKEVRLGIRNQTVLGK